MKPNPFHDKALATFLAAAIYTVAALPATGHAADPNPGDATVQATLEKIELRKGICTVLGLPEGAGPEFITDLADASELQIFFQSPDVDEVTDVCALAGSKGLLGKQIFAAVGSWESIYLANNLSGAILVSPGAQKLVAEAELLRALHPGGMAILSRQNPNKAISSRGR